MNRKVFRAAAWGLALGLAAYGSRPRRRRRRETTRPDKQVVEKRGSWSSTRTASRRSIEGDGPMVRRGYLGVGLTELTPELRTHFGVPEESGVMVSKVEPGSPAEKAGSRSATS